MDEKETDVTLELVDADNHDVQEAAEDAARLLDEVRDQRLGNPQPDTTNP